MRKADFFSGSEFSSGQVFNDKSQHMDLPESRVGSRPVFGRGPSTARPSVFSIGVLTMLGLAGLVAVPSGAQLVATDRTFLPGNEVGDRNGEAVAVGDFNGDGFDDLAVGVPGESIGAGVPEAGRIVVYLGRPGGIPDMSLPSFFFFESSLLNGSAAAGNRFGAALASADFNLDGFDDLAIGIPGQTVDGQDNAGHIAVVSGAGDVGLDPNRALFFDQSSLAGTPRAGDQFGASLAAGRLGNEEHPDLAIGVPGEEVGGFDDAGAVNLLFSSSRLGLSPINNAFIHQNSPGVFGIASPNDRFSAALAIGDVTGDGINDLVIGSPGDLVGTSPGSGAVQVLPGEESGVAINSDQMLWNQDIIDVLGDSETGDDFGNSIILGHFNGDIHLDLAIGIPGDAQFGPQDSGAVQVLYGTALGLSAFQNQLLFESLVNPEVAAFDRFGETLAAGDFDADGDDDLAIGYHLDNVFGQVNAGNVAVLPGSRLGVQTTGAQLWNGFFLLTVETGDELGFALATGRFAGNGASDLVIGVPGRETEEGEVQAGGSLIVRSDSLFSDDFEFGNTNRWSATVN